MAAPISFWSSSSIERMTIRTAGISLLIRRVASSPPISGIRIHEDEVRL